MVDMALYLYFKKKENLPDPNGPLAQSVPSSSIEAVNSNVRSVIESDMPPQKRGQYGKYTPEQKAMISKRPAEHGVVAAVRYYIKQFPNLKENTVRDWRNAYRIELKKRVREGSAGGNAMINISELPMKKKGRPLLLGEELDKQVQSYLTNGL